MFTLKVWFNDPWVDLEINQGFHCLKNWMQKDVIIFRKLRFYFSWDFNLGAYLSLDVLFVFIPLALNRFKFYFNLVLLSYNNLIIKASIIYEIDQTVIPIVVCFLFIVFGLGNKSLWLWFAKTKFLLKTPRQTKT